MSWLERIQQKPEVVRTRYLFAAVGASFLFVLVVWFFSLKTSVLGVSSIDSSDGAEVIQKLKSDVGAPPSLDGLLKAGKTLQDGVSDDSNATGDGESSAGDGDGVVPTEDASGIEASDTSGDESILPDTSVPAEGALPSDSQN